MNHRALPLALALCAGVPAQTTQKLLVLGVDGVRPDALAVANTPNIDALIQTGSYSDAAHTEDLTFSGPNWSTILHGVHRDKHGVTTNGYSNNRLVNYPDFLALLENHRQNWKTVRITTWDAIHIHQPTGADVDLFANYTSGGDAIATTWAAQLMLGAHPSYPNFDVDALFIYFADPDVTGHGYGFDAVVPEYLRELEDVDTQIGRIVTAIKARPNYAQENWLIIMTSDHGGSISGGHGGNSNEKRTVPFLVSGPSAIVGTPFPPPKNVDVVKTALTHMGVPIPANLDGHVVGLSPTSGPALAYNVNLLANSGAEYDRGFAGTSIDQHVTGWHDPGPAQATAIPYDTPGGWPLSTDPGPPNRGKNFFCGNSKLGSRLSQTIDVSGFKTAIDAGMVSLELSGWLGGFSSQNDRARLDAYCRDAKGTLLGTATIGPVTNTDRGNLTALLYRLTTVGVPKSTRSIVIALDTIFAAGGTTDGYADELAFVLRSSPASPPAAVPHHVPTQQTTEWRFGGSTGNTIDRAYGPGTMEYADGPAGATARNDSFGVSNGSTVPHIDSTPVSYLHFKRRSSRREGYKVRVGIPTPGEAGIRQFTMIFDVFIEASNSDNYLGIWNGNPTNQNDCEFFLRPVNNGYWTTNASTRDGTWRRGAWNRIAFVEDFAAGTVKVYNNGNPVLELQDAAGDYVLDGNPDPFWFLSDNTPSETSAGYLASFAFVNKSLDAREIGALGGSSASGIFADGLDFYGCGLNPRSSLTHIGGLPMLGTALTLGVHNPIGTQTIGSATALLISHAADPSFPCGTHFPGWGMLGPNAVGELLVVTPLIAVSGPSWSGAPTPIRLGIPNVSNLVGLPAFVQGLILDITTPKIGLAGAVMLTFY